MSSTEQVIPHNRKLIAVQLAALSALGPFCIDAYLPSMVDIARAFGVSLEAVQATLTVYMVPFALMTLWHGSLSDALGRKRVVLWGLGVFLFASLGCACAPNLTWLIAFRILQGATAGVGMVVGRAVVRDLYDGPSAQRMMAMVSIVFAAAPAIAPLIGGWLHHWFGWRSVFVFMATYAGSLLVYCGLYLPETLPPSKRQPFNPAYLIKAFLGVLQNKVFIGVSLASTFAFIGFFVYVLSAPVFLMKHLHVSETGFIWLFGPVTLGIITGNFLSARVAGILSLMRTVSYACGIMVTLAALHVAVNLFVTPVLPWAVLPIFVYMLGMSLALPSLTITALDCFPKQRGLAASCQSFIQNIGCAIMSLAAPLFWGTQLSLSLTMLVFATLCASCVFLVIRWKRA